MARADLILDLVRAGARDDRLLFRKALEALIAEERAKQHHILADRLAAHLQPNGRTNAAPVSAPTRRDGLGTELFYEAAPERRVQDLVLPQVVENAILELTEEHRRADLLRAHNLEPRHRVLLTGPPGNRKTSLAEALATELGSPLLVVRYESVIGSYLGETAIRLSKLFEQVRTRRCVLFFDEFDVVGKERGDVHETGEIKRVVSSPAAASRRPPESCSCRDGHESSRAARSSSVAAIPATAAPPAANSGDGRRVVSPFSRTTRLQAWVDAASLSPNVSKV